MGREGPGTYGTDWAGTGYEVVSSKLVGATPPEPNNWGRWGDDDQRGTTNLITPEIVAEAAGLIRTGQRLSLAIPIDAGAPVHYTRPKAMRLHSMAGSDSIVGSPQNQVFFEGMQWTDDVIVMALQGSTQWDGLAHLIRDDAMYNGWWAGEVTAAGGANRNGVQHQKEELVGRGVLLDVCGHRGGAPMAGGEAITPRELDEVAAAQGVELRTGDMVLIRTGYLGHWYGLDDFRERNDTWFTTEPGVTREVANWCQAHDVAALAVDNWGIDVFPNQPDADRIFPFHQVAIPGLGLTLGEFWWLDDLAAACAADGRYAFFLAAQPLNVTNASGSMLNPLVIK